MDIRQAIGFAMMVMILVALGLGGLGGCTKSPTESYRPDNTAVNRRDANGTTATAQDQSENEADRTTTQKIRQALVQDETLSLQAKNVKVITVDGNVTLRGPVQTAQERQIIEERARTVSGVGRVDNQLEVLSQP